MNFELSEEQIMLREMTRKFAEQEMLPSLRDYEEKQEVNRELIGKLADLGLLGAHLPKEYGGGGIDYLSCAIIWEELSRVSWTMALGSVGHAVLSGTIIMHAASDEQKEKYLPPLCRGKLLFATATVEPNAGSDATAIEASAKLNGDHWVLNGTKNFVTGGRLADVILVLAQTDKSLGTKGMVLLAVEKETAGLSYEHVELVGGRTSDIANLAFADCRVPAGNLIGKVGRGLHGAFHGIDTARVFITAGALGMAQSCLNSSIKYARERLQFGKPIASFQLVQETIARLAAEIETIRWQLYYAAQLKDAGKSHGKELSAAKWLASELAVRAASEAIRLHGAYGCSVEYPLEHHYRDAVLATILGGTSEMHKLMIGRELLGINAMS
ncbi:MAG: acyl-CoA dehydrogenase family protein [Deltaproteobacteria bacterium]|nr:acyl-CoA dehydrogenase family protein [Candidatus Anaeroferrophillus wilburensis]MBN2888754.1 acyl-CoA dehydrogenase family protein [Deltaproteobacteria bacterium]